MASSSIGAKIIRLADIIHNCESIIEQDPKHTLKVLLPMLKAGSPKELYNECRELLLTHS